VVRDLGASDAASSCARRGEPIATPALVRAREPDGTPGSAFAAATVPGSALAAATVPAEVPVIVDPEALRAAPVPVLHAGRAGARRGRPARASWPG
jgi:hypothetical protein